jgi:mono/diheme cytochrome c family protein
MAPRTARLGFATVAVIVAFAAAGGPSAAQESPAPPAPPTAVPSTTAAAPAPVASGDLKARMAKGGDLFANYGCGSCHSLAAAGADGHVGPSLDDPNLTEDQVKNMVTNGSGPMPAFGGQLSKDDIAALAAYVVHSGTGK